MEVPKKFTFFGIDNLHSPYILTCAYKSLLLTVRFMLLCLHHYMSMVYIKFFDTFSCLFYQLGYEGGWISSHPIFLGIN